MIDSEVRRLIEEAHDNARKRISDNRKTLAKIAEYLIEYETAEDKVLDELFSGTGQDDEPEAVLADD